MVKSGGANAYLQYKHSRLLIDLDEEVTTDMQSSPSVVLVFFILWFVLSFMFSFSLLSCDLTRCRLLHACCEPEGDCLFTSSCCLSIFIQGCFSFIVFSSSFFLTVSLLIDLSGSAVTFSPLDPVDHKIYWTRHYFCFYKQIIFNAQQKQSIIFRTASQNRSCTEGPTGSSCSHLISSKLVKIFNFLLLVFGIQMM